jgi:membrane-bound inhibitor of C-type lysozyme
MRAILLSASLLLGLVACKPDEPEAPPAEPAPTAQAESPAPVEPSAPADVPDAAAPPAPAVTKTTRNFQCGDHAVQATFEGESATVLVDGKTLTLPHVPSGSGARYADDTGNEIFTKGEDEVMVILAGEGLGTCVAQTAAQEAAAAPVGSDYPLAREACLDAVAKATNVDRAKLKVTEVLWAEAGVGVSIEVPGADAPWSCLSSEDGKVQGAAYTGSEGAL